MGLPAAIVGAGVKLAVRVLGGLQRGGEEVGAGVKLALRVLGGLQRGGEKEEVGGFKRWVRKIVEYQGYSAGEREPCCRKIQDWVKVGISHR